MDQNNDFSQSKMNHLEIKLETDLRCENQAHYFCLITDYEERFFQLKNNEKKTFILEKGSDYFIFDQTKNAEGVMCEIEPSKGVIESFTQVLIRKNYDESRVFKRIQGQVFWNYDCEDSPALPESIIVLLKDDYGNILNKKEVKRDAHDRWAYDFKVPQYEYDGSKKVYYLETEDSTRYETEVIGSNIKNTLYTPLACSFNMKYIADKAKSKKYQLQFERIDEKSFDGRWFLNLDEDGSYLLGPIYFYKPGIYVYRASLIDEEKACLEKEVLYMVLEIISSDYRLELASIKYLPQNDLDQRSFFFFNVSNIKK